MIPKRHQPLSAGALQAPSRTVPRRRVTQWTIDDSALSGFWMAITFRDGAIWVDGRPSAGETLEQFCARVRQWLSLERLT
jgi:hypothetical protein